MKRRVVVTGLGAVTPIGVGAEDFWSGIKEGKNGIDFITAFDTTDYSTKLAAEVKDFDASQFVEKKEAKRMDRFVQFAVASAKMAIQDSKLDLESINKHRFGVIVGSGIGGMLTIEAEHKKLLEKGPKRVTPLLIPMIISNMAAGNVAIQFGAKGPCTNVVTACATGTHAIGDAFKLIQDGRADVMLAGGTEAAITPLSMAGFSALQAMSTSTDPESASRPFDANRDGFVMGEGAGVLVLEDLEHAVARGAHIYAEVVGYGMTGDAYHITAPDSEGDGGARALLEAIEDGNVPVEELDYINAHGTSTPLNDKVETLAIKKALGEQAKKVMVSSTKAITGHLLGAAGAIEAIVIAKAVEEDYVPATFHYQNTDAECDLDIVPNEGRNTTVRYAASNSLGFGGHNATIIFKKYSK